MPVNRFKSAFVILQTGHVKESDMDKPNARYDFIIG